MLFEEIFAEIFLVSIENFSKVKFGKFSCMYLELLTKNFVFKLFTDRFYKSNLNLDGYSCSNANKFESILLISNR